jgi:hypothetical protein
VPAGGRAPAEERFLAADFAREEAPDGARRQAAARPAAPASLSKRLASELPAQAQPDRASVLEAADGDAAPLPRADGIVAVVHELGGFQRGTWQRRVFEYHPLSKCVVWRKSRQAPVKGFLLVSPELEVERVAKGVKGRPFVMEISAFSKVRQIAFETQWELDRWLVTLEAARVQQ